MRIICNWAALFNIFCCKICSKGFHTVVERASARVLRWSSVNYWLRITRGWLVLRPEWGRVASCSCAQAGWCSDRSEAVLNPVYVLRLDGARTGRDRVVSCAWAQAGWCSDRSEAVLNPVHVLRLAGARTGRDRVVSCACAQAGWCSDRRETVLYPVHVLKLAGAPTRARPCCILCMCSGWLVLQPEQDRVVSCACVQDNFVKTV